jgi:hypothetical protein
MGRFARHKIDTERLSVAFFITNQRQPVFPLNQAQAVR